MNGWKDEFTMDIGLFNEIMDMIIETVEEKIKRRNLTDIPLVIFVASPDEKTDKRAEIHEIHYDYEATDEIGRYRELYHVGSSIGEQGIIISAVYMVFGSYAAMFEKEEDIPENLSKHDEAREVISFAGMTIEKDFNMAIMDIDRDEDNNAIITRSVERIFPSEEEKVSADSDMIMSFMAGYITAMAEIAKEEPGI